MPLRGQGVVTPMGLRLAGASLFLDVFELAPGGEVAVTTDDASTAERGEPEKHNQVAHMTPGLLMGYASFVPVIAQLGAESHSRSWLKAHVFFPLNFALLMG